MPTNENTIRLVPREHPHGSTQPPSSFWLVGTREHYGSAMFVTAPRDHTRPMLYINNRPYGVNECVGAVDSLDLTWADIDNALGI